MALKHVLLGLIATQGPLSGYDLCNSVIKMRRPQLSQIYLALKDLTKDKLVEYERIHSEDGPTKKLYTMTPAGYEELRRWLKKTDNIKPVHEPLMPKMWFAGMSDKNDYGNSLKAFIKYRKDELSFYKKLKKTYLDTESSSVRIPSGPVHRFYGVLALEYMIDRSEADMEWAEKTIQSILNTDLDNLEVGDAPTSGKKHRKKTT